MGAFDAAESLRAATGRIHSYESCGTVDGPGIRFVVFLQGCPLRCKYCHNPDTWNPGGGTEIAAGKVVAEARKYKSYMRYSNGGLTLTGGEPLLQPEFAAAILALCQSEGIHTALDTSGVAEGAAVERALEATDLVLLDIKSIDAEQHLWLTGAPLDAVLDFARRVDRLGRPMWIRHVLVPGITLREGLVESFASFVASLDNVQLVELLPFHQLGEYKWEAMGYRYELADTPVPSTEQVQMARAIVERRGIRLG